MSNESFSFFRTTQTSSIQATDRLMKEIKSIYKSQSFKDSNYSIDIINDNVYEWSVSLPTDFQFNIMTIYIHFNSHFCIHRISINSLKCFVLN